MSGEARGRDAEETGAYKLPSSHDDDVDDVDNVDSGVRAPGPSEDPPGESVTRGSTTVDVFETCFPARERMRCPRESVNSTSYINTFDKLWR